MGRVCPSCDPQSGPLIVVSRTFDCSIRRVSELTLFVARRSGGVFVVRYHQCFTPVRSSQRRETCSDCRPRQSLQLKVVQTVQQHCLVWIYSDTWEIRLCHDVICRPRLGFRYYTVILCKRLCKHDSYLIVHWTTTVPTAKMSNYITPWTLLPWPIVSSIGEVS